MQLGFDFDKADTAREKFEQYHRDHPEVYRELVRLAYEWYNNGHAKLGMQTLIERVRWEFHMYGKYYDGFKINNNFSPYYARKIMREHPELEGLFELRTLRSN